MDNMDGLDELNRAIADLCMAIDSLCKRIDSIHRLVIGNQLSHSTPHWTDARGFQIPQGYGGKVEQ